MLNIDACVAAVDDALSAADQACYLAKDSGRNRVQLYRPDDQQVRVLVRVPRSASIPLAAALRAAQAVRSARKDAGAVRVQLDPAELI